MNMDKSLWDAISLLRSEGYSVAVFTPDELEGSDPDRVEDLMVERGWDAINILKEETS